MWQPLGEIVIDLTQAGAIHQLADQLHEADIQGEWHMECDEKGNPTYLVLVDEWR